MGRSFDLVTPENPTRRESRNTVGKLQTFFWYVFHVTLKISPKRNRFSENGQNGVNGRWDDLCLRNLRVEYIVSRILGAARDFQARVSGSPQNSNGSRVVPKFEWVSGIAQREMGRWDDLCLRNRSTGDGTIGRWDDLCLRKSSKGRWDDLFS